MTQAADTDIRVGQPEMVTLTIDGVEISVPKGTLVIRAAELMGIQIPRFCDHPLLEPVGACRQCLVEVEGQRKPLASCTTVATDDMVVRTQLTSEIADKAQHGVMELLLINHPLDCPMCDKGGECPLQNQAMSNGRTDSRFTEAKRTFAKPINISAQVLLDRERCILCARCTRFSDQIAGDPFIDMQERGALQQVGIYADEPFESYFSGNTVQICPVGALTGTVYRFRARPFDLVSSPSVCEHCASGCAQRTDHRRGKVLRRLAGDDPEVNEEWNCDKGRWAFTYATQPDVITTPLIQEALAAASAAPGYPATAGTARLRESVVAALARRYGITRLTEAAVLPVIGTKELIAWLPTLLGLGGADLVVVPELAYPTYDVGARLAGTRVLRADALTQLGPQSPALLYLNSPSNPTGRVLGVDHLRKVVEWARGRGVLVVSDECYLGLGWDAEPVSVLHPSVCDGDHTGLLAVHSLSKSSSLAGYRAGFVVGDLEIVAELLAVRKHAGMMVPAPVQAAMVAALDDDAHERQQRERYAQRRAALLPALGSAGFAVDYSDAGLYLWATRGEPCRDSVAWLAQRGILVAPGDFYGPGGAQHVRVALTATDERVAAAVGRLTC